MQLPISMALQLVIVQLPTLMGYFLPLFFFLSSILTILRFRHSNEMIVFEASGFSKSHLQKVLFKSGLMVVAVVGFFILFAKPYLGRVYETLKADAINQSSIELLTPGKFYSADGGKLIYYAIADRDHRDKPAMFVALKPEKTKGWDILLAKNARHAPYLLDETSGHHHALELSHGELYRGDAGSQAFSITSFTQMQKLMHVDVKNISSNPKFMSNSKLFEGVDHPFYAAELHWRLAGMVSMLILMFMILPLSHSKPRETSHIHVLTAVLIYVLYINLLLFLRSGIKQGWINIWLGLWPAHFLMLVVMGLLYWWKEPQLLQMKRRAKELVL